MKVTNKHIEGLCTLFAFLLSWQIFGFSFGMILADIVVIMLFGAILFRAPKTLLTFSKHDIGVGVFVTLLLASLFFHQQRSSLFEGMKLVYLFFMYTVIRSAVQQVDDKEKLINQVFLWMLVGAIASVLISLILQFGIKTHDTLVYYREDFPFVGDVFRIRGLCVQPGNLASLIGIGMIYLWPQNVKWKWPVIAISCVLLLFTISKAMLLVAVCVLIGWLARNLTSLKRAGATVIVIMGVTSFFVFTLFQPIEKNTEIPRAQQYQYAKQPIRTIGGYDIYPSVYFLLKKTAVKAIKKNWFKGAGPARFPQYLEKQSTYPSHMPHYEAHDTYLGTVAEYGILGLCALIVLSITLFKAYSALDVQNTTMIAIGTCILFIMIHATMTDDHHLRHFWLILISLGVLQKQRKA